MVSVEQAVPLYEGVPPGSERWRHDEQEFVLPAPVDLRMLRNVVRPTLTPVLPSDTDATGAGILVCPGGGYFALAIDHEGFEIAEWLAERGIAAFVLKYRVIETPTSDAFMQAMSAAGTADGLAETLRRMDTFASIPLADGSVAVQLVRTRADDWAVRTDRLGAIGFSAGARLVLDLARQADRAERPTFVAAIYGPALRGDVPDDAPPLFVAAAAEDPFFDNALETTAAWRRAGGRVEAHLYARGGHGFGSRPQGLPLDGWRDQFRTWVEAEGFLG